MIRRVIASLAAVAVAGCSGSGMSYSPIVARPQAHTAAATATGRATLNVTLRIPRHGRRGARDPHYISASTKSIVISAKAGKTVAKAYANVTPASPDCKGTLLALTCTAKVSLEAGSYAVTISTYDAKQKSASGPLLGHLLSTNTVSAKVVAGKKNAIHATLDAVPATLTVTAGVNQANVEGNDGGGLTTLGGSSSTILVAAYDADGNVIVGGGAPALSIVVSGATGGITTTHSATNLNAFTLSSTGFGHASLAVTATPVHGAAVSINVAVDAVTTTALLAGQPGTYGHSDGSGSSASFYYPAGMAYDPDDGSLYVVDAFNCTIRKVTTGGVVTTVAGTTLHCDSTGTDLNSPTGAAYDHDNGYLYVADTTNCTIDAVPLKTGTFSRIAGTAGMCDGTGTDLNNPFGVTYAGNHTLYVTDTYNCVIRKIASIDTTPVTTTFAGAVGTCNATGSDFHDPAGITYDGSGTLYVADAGNCEVRKIVISGPSVSTLTGSASTCNAVDGTGTSASWSEPFGIAYDQDHAMLYVTDSGADEIRQVTTAAAVVTTIAGTGRYGYQEGSLLQSAVMYAPEGVVYVGGGAGTLGTVYVLDSGNEVVRRMNL